MKLSDITKEIEEFITEFGDKEISGVDVHTNSSNFSSVLGYGDNATIRIAKDGRYAVILFNE